MALDSNIYWLGRQWAVTGHGLQLIDQKLDGFFDIRASRLWDETLIEKMRAKEWLNLADFDKGIAIARARYPEESRNVVERSPASVLPVNDGSSVELRLPKLKAVKAQAAPQMLPRIKDIEKPSVIADEPVKSPAAAFYMQFTGIAKFVHPWRIAQGPLFPVRTR
jgi:hypothetical protein